MPKASGIFERDIWRAASLLIRQYGDSAELMVAQRAELMLDRGDRVREFVWMLIKRAVAALQAPPKGKLH